MSRRVAALLSSLVGERPARSAPVGVKQRFTRRVYLRLLPPQIVVYGSLVILDAPTWLLIVPAAGAAFWICGFVLINLEMWRGRR